MSLKTIRRRRKEGKTDYRLRFGLLKSSKPRIIIRKTNRYIIVQLVETDIAQDKIVVTFSSRDLLSKGWPKEATGSLKSLQAAYLSGLMLGKSLKGKVKEAILDLGMNRNVHGSRVYAALKGVLDAGINIPHDPKSLPTEVRFKSNDKLFTLMQKLKDKV